MEDSLEAARARAAAAQRAADEDRLFYYVLYKEFPQYGCDANEALIREFHGGEDITAESIREAIAALQGKLATLSKAYVKERAAASDSQERERLLSKLKDLHASETLLSRIRYQTTAQLRAKVAELESVASVQNLNHDQLRKVATPAATAGYPPVPSTFTKFQIQSMSGEEWRNALRKYGPNLNAHIRSLQERGEW